MRKLAKYLWDIVLLIAMILIVDEIVSSVVSNKITKLEEKFDELERKNDSLKIEIRHINKQNEELKQAIKRYKGEIKNIANISVPNNNDTIRAILKDPYGYGYRYYLLYQERGEDLDKDSSGVSRVEGQ